MKFRAILLLTVALGLLHAQGTKTRDDAAKYSQHAQVDGVSIGADFWGRVIPLNDTTLRTRDYLVVEVALFAAPSAKVAIEAKQFVLKANGERLLPVAPGLVTLAMVMPDLDRTTRHVEADGSVGPLIISEGRPAPQPKFPGDSIPADDPVPPPGQPSAGLPKDPFNPAKAVQDAALPEGNHATPISGYLFYEWPGKLKRLKHAEMEYTSASGVVTLQLR